MLLNMVIDTLPACLNPQQNHGLSLPWVIQERIVNARTVRNFVLAKTTGFKLLSASVELYVAVFGSSHRLPFITSSMWHIEHCRR